MAQRTVTSRASASREVGKSRGRWNRETHVRHRDYSPTLGRFIEQDPIGFEAGDNNWYRFVANGPTGKMDPGGLRGALPWWLPPIVIEQLAEEFIGYEDAVKKAMDGAIRKATDLVLKATIEQHRTGGFLARGRSYTLDRYPRRGCGELEALPE